MKKIIIITAFLFGILASCSKIDIQTKEDKGDCLVTINPIGEISTSYNPLTKASTDNIYMLHVYQNDTSYAMGLYNDLSKMKVYLHKGLRYKFIISVAYSALDNLPLSSNNANAIEYQYISQPSCYDISFDCCGFSGMKSDFSGWSSTIIRSNLLCEINSYYGTSYLNSTYYSHKPYLLGSTIIKYYKTYPSSSSSSSYTIQNNYIYHRKAYLPDIGKAKIKNEINPTNLSDWFYGEATFTPNGQYETLDMNFKRVGYKLKYELNGVTDGEVTVTIKTQSGKVLIQNTTNTETYSGDAIFVPYYDIASVYQNPSSYFENLIVSVSWLRGIGVTQDLGSTTIQVKRNNLNRVRISLGNSDAGAAMNLSTEAESMGTESTDITVE